jgi:hypothetical protein
VVYLGATLVLAQTASQGGRLVHEFGVRAMLDKPEQETTERTAGTVSPTALPAKPRAPLN